MFGKVAFNTIIQGVGKLTGLLVSLATTVILTRSLGLEGYGAYAFITALVLFFGTISDWGTNIITVREASQKKEKQAVIFGSALLFRFFLAALALFLLNLVVRINPGWKDFVVPVTIGSFVLLALSLKTSLGIIFQTLLKYEFAVGVEASSSLIFLLLVVFSISRGFGLSGVITSWVLATFLACLFGFYFARRITQIKWRIDTKVVKRIFWEAAPAGMLFLFFNLYNRIDMIILEYFKGAGAVGIYGLAYKVYDNLILGAAFLMNAMFPLLSAGAAKTDGAGLKNYYQKAFDLLLGAALTVFLLFFFIAPWIIRILGGQEFLPSISVLQILLFATVISYFNHLTGYSLIAFGRQRLSMFIALGALIFNVLANLVLIPIYSYTGAAVVTIATEGLVLLLSLFAVKKTTGLLPSPSSFIETWTTLVRRKKNIF